MKSSILPSIWEITIISFILILLTGKASGGPYILYYGAGLVNGVQYSVLAAGGFLLCFASSFLKDRDFEYLKALSAILGILLLVLSIADFLSRERLHPYSWMNGPITPIASFILFSLSSLIAIGYNIVAYINRFPTNQGHQQQLR